MIPMVEEVDKLIYNLLVSQHAVHIPTVGSLFVERVPARRFSKRRIVPPYFAVIYTSYAVGESLVAAIAKIAGCDHAMAEEVFGRWLTRTMEDGVLTIGGVGVLRQKGFAVEAAFDRAINQLERNPIPVRHADNHWIFWTTASIAIVCGIGACGWVLYDRAVESSRFDPAQHRTQTPVQSTPQPAVVADSVVDLSGEAAAESVAAAEVVPAATVQPAATLEAQPTTSGCSYVVLGVFSTQENAQRAAREAMSADTALRCGVWNFGSKFMVSLFASDDAAACAEFVRTHTDRYPEAWCHKAR